MHLKTWVLSLTNHRAHLTLNTRRTRELTSPICTIQSRLLCLGDGHHRDDGLCRSRGG